MKTDRVIERLVENLEPTRPLHPPWLRVGAWLALALPYIALVVFVVSPRADLLSKAWDWRFVIEQSAALFTGAAAAYAAFASTIPGFNRKILLLPAVPLAIWLASIGQGCISDWMRLGSEGLSFRPDFFCFPAIVVVGAVPALAMAIMLRRGAPLTPCTTVALGGFAAAGLGNFGLRMFHAQDASLMILVWQIGSVFLLTAMAGCIGRRILNWRMLIGNTMRKSVIN